MIRRLHTVNGDQDQYTSRQERQCLKTTLAIMSSMRIDVGARGYLYLEQRAQNEMFYRCNKTEDAKLYSVLVKKVGRRFISFDRLKEPDKILLML